MVPASFVVPELLETPDFRLRPLTVNDLIKDFDAVMTSVDRLYRLMSPTGEWPHGLTLEEDLIDLGWHQREFTLRHSFAYTVMAPDESICLGCCYLYPSDDPAFDAEAFYWVRESHAALDEKLGAVFRQFLTAWPFKRVAFPGRDQPWLNRQP